MHCFTNLTLSLLLAPSGAIQNFAAQSITSRQASLVWEDVACLYRGGILVAYEVTIRDPNSAVTGQRRNVTQRTLTVTDLIPFTRYGFTVRYFNRIGPGPNSTEYLLTTLEDSKNQITYSQNYSHRFARDQSIWDTYALISIYIGGSKVQSDSRGR